ERGKSLVRLGCSGSEEVVGFCAVRRLIENEWELENVTVALSERRSGVGTALLGDLIARVGDERTAGIFLEVRASNFAARRLYEKFSWREVGRRAGYYAAPREDAVLYLWKASS
ncbi:MAG: GNAT family N-acetyltransferase, partial [Acidobacteriaceae bacterium]